MSLWITKDHYAGMPETNLDQVPIYGHAKIIHDEQQQCEAIELVFMAFYGASDQAGGYPALVMVIVTSSISAVTASHLPTLGCAAYNGAHNLFHLPCFKVRRDGGQPLLSYLLQASGDEEQGVGLGREKKQAAAA